MGCSITEEELWSGIDRGAVELAEHIASCPTCRLRADEMRSTMAELADQAPPKRRQLPDRIGSYTVTRLLGEGGMGIVYEAEQHAPRRTVAVKVVRGGQYVDDLRVKLFEREARTLARLQHPSIGAIYEAGRTDDGQHFFAMELVHGVPLNEYVRREKLTLRERMPLFCRICDAVNYAHQRGVIHRDLKPSNIIIEPEGNPKVLDFGLARITDPDAPPATTLTEAGRFMGTLPYMSPEEARGSVDEIDVRSDVYALGVIFYELMTDRLPYVVSKARLHEAVNTICTQEPRRPRTIHRVLRGDVDIIALKSLEKDRARRYQTAGAFAEDIRRHLSDQPILARRASAVYQLRKFVARHRLVVGFAVAMLAVVVAARVWVTAAERDMRVAHERLVALEDVRVAAVLMRLAKLFQDLHQYDQAKQLYYDARAKLFDQADKESGRMTEVLLGLRSVLMASAAQHRREGHLDEAKPLYREALDRLAELPADQPAYRAQALIGLGNVLADVAVASDDADRELDEAENVLIEAIDIIEADLPAGRATGRMAFEAFAALKRLYTPELLDAPEALAEVREEIDALRKAHPDAFGEWERSLVHSDSVDAEQQAPARSGPGF